MQISHPVGEAVPKFPGVHQHEHIAEGVFAKDPVFEGKELLQEQAFGPACVGHVANTFSATQQGLIHRITNVQTRARVLRFTKKELTGLSISMLKS